MVSGPHLDADLWGDGDEEEGQGGGGGGADLEREWRARREEHWAGGYREGLEAGKHETVQEGFDEGERAPRCRWGLLPLLPLLLLLLLLLLRAGMWARRVGRPSARRLAPAHTARVPCCVLAEVGCPSGMLARSPRTHATNRRPPSPRRLQAGGCGGLRMRRGSRRSSHAAGACAPPACGSAAAQRGAAAGAAARHWRHAVPAAGPPGVRGADGSAGTAARPGAAAAARCACGPGPRRCGAAAAGLTCGPRAGGRS